MDKTELPHFYKAKIFDIVHNSKWGLNETQSEHLYERLVIRCASLQGKDEWNLFIKLCEMYRFVGVAEYLPKLIALLERIIDKQYSGQQRKVFIAPLKRKDNHGSIKSADYITYLTQSVYMKYSRILSKKRFIILGSFEQIVINRKSFLNKPLLLIDDFIGSGNYATEVLKQLKDVGLSPGEVLICTLFITPKGLDRITKEGYSIEYLEMVNSVLPILSERERKLLAKIEDDMAVPKDLHFGYSESATLITLLRTPNNTLPVFWFLGKEKKLAPFERL
jgi:hypothetical protein